MADEEKKIVVIGAGSADFGMKTLSGIMINEALHGMELALVDINEGGLSKVERLARIVNERWGAGMRISSSTERRDLLQGADYIIVCIAVDRELCWKDDYETALKYNITHYAENGGPGGFIHAARSVSALLGIIDDINELCPGALVINFTNPMTRVCTAFRKLSRSRFVGMCHGILFGYYILGTLFAEEYGVELKKDIHFRWNDDFTAYRFDIADRVSGHLEIRAAGLNHFTCMIDVRDRETGESRLELVKKRFLEAPAEFEPLTRDILKIFDIVLVQGDTHICEYLPFTADRRAGTFQKYDIALYDFSWGSDKRAKMWEEIERMVNGRDDIWPLKGARSERAECIMGAMEQDGSTSEEAVNVVNRGAIGDLPPEAVVEVPVDVSAKGVEGHVIGAFPSVMAEWCRRQLLINEMTVDAVLEGNMKTVYQLFALDPMITSLDSAVRLADEYIRKNRKYLPTFS